MSNMSAVYDAIRTSGGRASIEQVRIKTGLTRQQVTNSMSYLETKYNVIKRSKLCGRCFAEITGKYRDLSQDIFDLLEDNPESEYTALQIRNIIGAAGVRMCSDRLGTMKRRGLVECRLKDGTQGVYLWSLKNVTSENLSEN